MTALIVEDEPLARAHLRHLLKAQGVQVVGEAESAATALHLAEDLRPDLLLLDIRLPGLTGMELAEALRQMEPAPLLVFATADADHALEAFDHGAVDYLIKPISPERLAKALIRARTRLAELQGRVEIARRLTATATRGSTPPRRLPVRAEGAVHLLRIEEIVCAEARDKRVFVRTQDGEYRTYYTLTQLEAQLSIDRFMRIHDSWIVNLDCIEKLLLLGNHSYAVRLSDHQSLPVGRRRYAELVRRLGLDTAPSPRESERRAFR